MMGPVAAEYALVSPHLKAEVWTKTETSYGELLVSCAKNRGVLPGQRGGGWEIRTPEGLPPTRFPAMLASVHGGPRQYVTSHDASRVVAGERFRTGVNETETETEAATAGSNIPTVARLRSQCTLAVTCRRGRCRPCSATSGSAEDLRQLLC
jgi:hypothetical protein